MLRLEDVHAGYEQVEVLHGVGLELEAGQFGVVLGPNGAGKSTLLLTILSLVRARRGDIAFAGQSIRGRRPHELARSGIGFVSEQLNLFPNMSVRENLLLGAFGAGRAESEERLGRVNELFPWLEERRGQSAGTLSGGQRKMLALGRALMGRPRLLLVDEPSNGLAPAVVTTLFDALDGLHRQGLTIVLVEQHVEKALALADRAWVLEGGMIRLEGGAAELRGNPYVRQAYLGV
jgi:branched-chain amino acid transport system ATP-binding protein